MTMTMTVHPTRASVVVTASAAAAWWLLRGARDAAASPASLESLVTAAVLLGGAVAAGAVSLTTVVALAQGLTGRPPRAADTLPAPLRRLIVGTVAAAVAAGAAIPAGADEAYPGWAPTVPTASASATPSPETSPVPPPSEKPAPTVAASPAPSPAAPTQTPERPAVVAPSSDHPVVESPVVELHAESWAPALPVDSPHVQSVVGSTQGAAAGRRSAPHVVVRGESLWSIAKGALAPGASDAEIAAAWPLIFAANRAVIGDNASLILPGQELTIPAEVAR